MTLGELVPSITSLAQPLHRGVHPVHLLTQHVVGHLEMGQGRHEAFIGEVGILGLRLFVGEETVGLSEGA